jgi:nucleotide-binding universal stress UspA family protein
MRLVVGIDQTAESLKAAELAARLAFRGMEVDLVHVVERLEPIIYQRLPANADVIDRLLKGQEDAGRSMLAAAEGRLREYGFAARTHLMHGFAANVLMEFATSSGADLLATGSEGRGNVEGLLFGSVSRKLAVSAPQSLLIAKQEPLPVGPVRAVFATDHSPYAQRCLARLLALAPRGFGKVTVMTAYPKALVGHLTQMLEHFKGDVATWIEKNLEEQNQAVRRTLATLGCEVESRVVSGEPRQAITRTMEETGATLVVLGAQGHGFLDRVTAGSVSYAQAVKSKYDTLMLRV